MVCLHYIFNQNSKYNQPTNHFLVFFSAETFNNFWYPKLYKDKNFQKQPLILLAAHRKFEVSISEKSEKSDSDRFEPKILKLRGVTTIIYFGCATWSNQNCRFYTPHFIGQKTFKNGL